MSSVPLCFSSSFLFKPTAFVSINMANTDSSRRHVQQLPYPWDFKVNEACSPDTSTTKVVSNEYYELTGAILGRLATMQDLSNNHPVFDEAPHEALMAYIGCIMRYANGQLPGQTPMSHILKCVTLGGSVTANFNNSTGPKHSEIRTELELAGCTGAAFMSIDFLFIPWWDGGHWRLVRHSVPLCVDIFSRVFN